MIRMIGLSILLSSLGHPGLANAEGGCPPGFYPQNVPGVHSCIPYPQYDGSDGDSGGARWADRWGAMAQDPANHEVGAVTDRTSKRAARNDAVAECVRRGGKKCKIVSIYKNQCLVSINGSTSGENIRSSSIEQAIRIGMEACAQRGDTGCSVFYQACSHAVRIR